MIEMIKLQHRAGGRGMANAHGSLLDLQSAVSQSK